MHSGSGKCYATPTRPTFMFPNRFVLPHSTSDKASALINTEQYTSKHRRWQKLQPPHTDSDENDQLHDTTRGGTASLNGRLEVRNYGSSTHILMSRMMICFEAGALPSAIVGAVGIGFGFEAGVAMSRVTGLYNVALSKKLKSYFIEPNLEILQAAHPSALRRCLSAESVHRVIRESLELVSCSTAFCISSPRAMNYLP